jgi:hypothetical protein
VIAGRRIAPKDNIAITVSAFKWWLLSAAGLASLRSGAGSFFVATQGEN